MEEAGFTRTPEQVRVRWKNLRKAYHATCPFYKLLDKLLGRRPLAQAGQNGMDVGFELML